MMNEKSKLYIVLFILLIIISIIGIYLGSYKIHNKHVSENETNNLQLVAIDGREKTQPLSFEIQKGFKEGIEDQETIYNAYNEYLKCKTSLTLPYNSTTSTLSYNNVNSCINPYKTTGIQSLQYVKDNTFTIDETITLSVIKGNNKIATNDIINIFNKQHSNIIPNTNSNYGNGVYLFDKIGENIIIKFECNVSRIINAKLILVAGGSNGGDDGGTGGLGGGYFVVENLNLYTNIDYTISVGKSNTKDYERNYSGIVGVDPSNNNNKILDIKVFSGYYIRDRNGDKWINKAIENPNNINADHSSSFVTGGSGTDKYDGKKGNDGIQYKINGVDFFISGGGGGGGQSGNGKYGSYGWPGSGRGGKGSGLLETKLANAPNGYNKELDIGDRKDNNIIKKTGFFYGGGGGGGRRSNGGGSGSSGAVVLVIDKSIFNEKKESITTD